jgi:hypothetical protein
MPTLKKNTLLQATQGNAKTKSCKRVFFSATQENFFSSLPFLRNLFSPTHGQSAKPISCASNVNRYLDRFVLPLDSNLHRTDRRVSGNSRFAKWRVQCFCDSLVQGSSSVFQLKFCAPKSRTNAKRQNIRL